MTAYIVRRRLPGASDSAVRDAIRRCREEAEAMAHAGHHIRYLRSVYALDAGGYCECHYEADSADTVRLATERAAVPFEEIDVGSHTAGM